MARHSMLMTSIFLSVCSVSSGFGFGLVSFPVSTKPTKSWSPCRRDGGVLGNTMRFQQEESSYHGDSHGHVSRRNALILSSLVLLPYASNAAEKTSKFTDDEWKQLVKDGKISKAAYDVLHLAKTEKPFTSQLLKEKRAGVFNCAACETPLFAMEKKFDSGTGWPSFWDKLEGVELDDSDAFERMVNMRTEVHCVNCKGHLGHVFDDGFIWSVPTNKRYCINGVALSFTPATAPASSSPA